MKSCPQCSKTYPDEYKVCPQDGRLLEPTVGKKSSGDIFDHLIDDKYKVIRLIGRGGMGAVYEAVHTTMQRRVAIKILNPDLVSNPAAMERFRREALASGRLKHSNAITIYDYGTTNRGEAYIVMEFLEGCSLNQEIQTGGPIEPSRVAWILAQACDAVHAAHQEGIIHRDLKPANIMIEKLRTGEVVKVLDFGIAKLALGANPNVMNLTGTGIIGTPQYMSPEQCQGHTVDARTDVYSLGIIAYEMLTGTLPFDGPAPLAIVIAQVKQPPPPIRERRSEVPESVESVVMKALAKDPAKRQQTAEELAKDFRRLVETLSPPSAEKQKTRVASRSAGLKSEGADRITSLETIARPPAGGPISSTGAPPSEISIPPINNLPPRPGREPVSMPTYASMERFVGRTPELSTLRAAWQRARAARGGRPVLIFGEPGIGKTRLAEELRERLEDIADEEVPLVLTGKFFEYGGAAPYQILLESLRQPILGLFARELQEDVPLGSEEERLLPKSFLKSLAADDYLSMFSSAQIGGGEQEKFRIFDQLTRLYTLAARRRGVLLFLDDMQWADELTLEFLAHLNRHMLTERLLIVVAMRSTVLTMDTHPLRRWMRQLDETGGFEQIMLPPLSNAEVRSMVEGMLGNAVQLTANLVQLMAEETKGNPYYVGEIIRQMISGGQIKRDKNTGWICAEVNEFDLPDSIAALAATPISRLKEKTADILAQAAVIGEEFTFDLLQHVTEMREDELLDAVEAGLKVGILREVVASGEDRYVFAQSTVHRVLYKRISRRRRKRLHGRVAEQLEKTAANAGTSSAAHTKDRLAGDLAYHYFRAEDWAQAMRYAMEAGYIKWKTFAVGEASKYYGWVAQGLQQLRALENTGRVSDSEIQKPEVLAQFHLNYGLLLIECAQIEEAEQQLQQALELCQSNDSRLLGRIQTALGRLCNLSGLSEQALEYARAGLERLRKLEDHQGVVTALHTIAEAHLAQGEHSTASDFLREALEIAERIDDRIGKAAALSGFGQMYYQQGKYGQALTSAKQALASARSHGNVFEERRSLSLLGNICLYLGQAEEARNYYEPALHMACALGHRLGEASGLSHLGDVLRAGDRYGEALENYQQAVRIARDIGNRLAEGRYLLNIGRVQQDRGEYKAALAALEQSLQIIWETSSKHVEAETLYAIGDTYRRLGKFPDATAAFTRASGLARELEYPQIGWRVQYGWALCEHAQGNTEEAGEHIRQGIELIESLRSDIADDEETVETFLRDKQPVFDLQKQVERRLGEGRGGKPTVADAKLKPAPATVVVTPGGDAQTGAPTSRMPAGQTKLVGKAEAADPLATTVLSKPGEGAGETSRIPDSPPDRPGKSKSPKAEPSDEIPDFASYLRQNKPQSVNDVLSDLMEFADQLGMDDLLGEGEKPPGQKVVERPTGTAKDKKEKTEKPDGREAREVKLDKDAKKGRPVSPQISLENLPHPHLPTPSSMPVVQMPLASSANSLETNFHQMLQSARAAGDRASERKILTLMASSLHSQGQTARARDNYQQALIIGKEMQMRQGEAALQNNIGETFREEGRYADALAYFRLALRSAREFKDDRAAEIALVNAGMMYIRLGQIKEALSMLNQARESNDITHDREMLAEAQQGFGEIYWIQKETARALDACQQALKVAREIGNIDVEWRAQWIIGRCRWARNEKPAATAALQSSLTVLDRRIADVKVDETRRRLLAERQEIATLVDEWSRDSSARPKE